jgi:YesN/AraC family two-component response regulator
MQLQAIICVDDERSILSGLQQQIQHAFGERFLLEFALSGDEALEIVEMLQQQSIGIPLMLTDEMMPGIKGHELIGKINEISPETHCVLLTGFADAESTTEPLDGPRRRIPKPWDRSEIVALVEEVCGPSK